MKQIVENLKNGEISIRELPCPAIKPGHLLIQTASSIISSGTEKMLLNFGKASLINKARRQPDKVRQVLAKVKTDGLASTIGAIQHKLNQVLPLGYSQSGIVIGIGSGVINFAIGDKVVSNGPHVEVACIPSRLCSKIPENVSLEHASLTVIASIALQGTRLLKPTLGEVFTVYGVGLIGLLTIQLLKANGCRVIAIDHNTARLKLAQQFGAEIVDLNKCANPAEEARHLSGQEGVDGVIIAANTSKHDLMHQAACMCRKRGRIILVGVAGLYLSRDDFYKKELTFQVSCSYGPGRYDASYEVDGIDYPLGFVRWTEQRNFKAILDLMAAGKLELDPLITHRFSIENALAAYELLDSKESFMGIAITYDVNNKQQDLMQPTIQIEPKSRLETNNTNAKYAFIGSGNFAAKVLIPAFKKSNISLDTVVTQGGAQGIEVAKNNHFLKATTNPNEVFNDDSIRNVVIATQHNSHANLVCRALESGKNAYVEKPLCISAEELSEIKLTYERHKANGCRLMVGFNRRFSPFVQKMKQLLDGSQQPTSFLYQINAGAIDANHWTQNRQVGGGRIVGELCHFVDLLRFLAGARIKNIQVQSMHPNTTKDHASIMLMFENGSEAIIQYWVNGHPSLSKERLEVFQQGKVLRLDNFRSLKAYGYSSFHGMKSWKQNKGHNECVAAFVNSIHLNQPVPIAINEIFEVSQACLDIDQMILDG